MLSSASFVFLLSVSTYTLIRGGQLPQSGENTEGSNYVRLFSVVQSDTTTLQLKHKSYIFQFQLSPSPSTR